MTKQDFVAIAAILYGLPREGVFHCQLHSLLCDELSRYFASVNPRFDRDEFYTTAGYTGAPLFDQEQG